MAKANDVREEKQTVSIELGGEERNLKYDLNAFAELEDMYGSPQKAMDALEEGSFKSLRALVWVGLLHENPDLTERTVGSWLDLNNMKLVAEKIGQAINKAMPSDMDAQIAEAQAEQNNQGNKSEQAKGKSNRESTK